MARIQLFLVLVAVMLFTLTTALVPRPIAHRQRFERPLSLAQKSQVRGRFRLAAKPPYKAHLPQPPPKPVPKKSNFKTFAIKVLLTSSFPVSNPATANLDPLYLTANGSTTSDKQTAASCHLSSKSGRLFCGTGERENLVPISAPFVKGGSVLMSGIRGSEGHGNWKRGVVDDGWMVEEGSGKLRWKRDEVKRAEMSDYDKKQEEIKARFVYKLNVDNSGQGSVWAVFGGEVEKRDSEVKLEAVYD